MRPTRSAATLDSLLAQTRGDWQAIIVDDGSRDTTRQIAQVYVARDKRFSLLANDGAPEGVSAARNRGIAAASGHWLLFLDADDTDRRKLSSSGWSASSRPRPAPRSRIAARSASPPPAGGGRPGSRPTSRAHRSRPWRGPSPRRPWCGAGSRPGGRAGRVRRQAPHRRGHGLLPAHRPHRRGLPGRARAARALSYAARFAVDRCPRHAGRRHGRHRSGVRRRPARRAPLSASRRRRRPDGRIEGDGARRECAVVRGGRCRPGRQRRCPADGPARPARRSCRALPADHRRGPGVRRAAPARRTAARRSCLRRARPRPVGRGRARGLSARPGAASAVCPRTRDLQPATPDRPVGRRRHVAGPPGHRPPRADRRRCRHRPGAGGVPQRRAGSSVISERLPWVASRPAT